MDEKYLEYLKYKNETEYFNEEAVQCATEMDRQTLKFIYSALYEDNHDTYDDNLVDAISTLDANVFNLCKAIIYQNFMLMRKIDLLAQRIDDIEKRT